MATIFVIDVSVCEGIWTAECDELGLVTETASYDELTERAGAIAPELAELTHVDLDSESICLRFSHEQLFNRLAG